MTFEADLFTVIKAAAPAVGTRVFPDFAQVNTQRPYITYQQIGGPVINPLDNAAPGVRFADVQVNVWSNTRAEALSIARAVEDAMRGATAFSARPLEAASADYDAEIPVYGCRQDFRCRFT